MSRESNFSFQRIVLPTISNYWQTTRRTELCESQNQKSGFGQRQPVLRCLVVAIDIYLLIGLLLNRTLG